MKDVAQALAQLPDDTRISVTVGGGDLTIQDLRRGFSAPNKLILTTTEASDLLGYSPEMWQKWAKADEVPGAWQDGPGGIWRLPYEGCVRKVRREQEEHAHLQKGRKRRGRGPWKNRGAATASAARAGAEGLPGAGLTLLEGGPAPVGRRPADDEESRASGVAGEGGED